MNKGHAVGCLALRNGVPCTCWNPLPKPLKPAIVTPNGKIQDLERRVDELEIEWRGLQDMAGDQRLEIHRLLGWLEAIKESDHPYDMAHAALQGLPAPTLPNDPGQQG